MMAHLTAVQARVTAASGQRVDIAWSSMPGVVPYVVLTAPPWQDSDERGVCGAPAALDFEVRVKSVAGTVAAVVETLARVRADLSPDSRLSPLVVAGRSATVQYVRSEFVDVDQSVTITSTDRRPVFGVDTYRVVSQPTA